MKDKEKQIEEMGKVMPEKIKDPLDNSRYIIFGKSLRREIARIYYNAGYRKLPEDSVVLSKKEYERLKRVKNEKDRLYEINLDLENQLIEKGWTDYEGADEIEKRASKETAEKIYTKIKDSFLMDSNNRYALKLWIEEQFDIEVDKNEY